MVTTARISGSRPRPTCGRVAAAALALIVLGAPRPAQGQKWAGGLGLGVSHTTMDAEWARDRGMGTSGLGVQFEMSLELFRVLVVAGEAQGLFYSDERPFSQSTTCIGTGCPSSGGGSSESSLSILGAAAAVGLQPPRLRLGTV